MSDLPKIVPHRLRSAAVSNALAATHPEADALTAFIEQALSPSEREGMLQHLALCADCRETVVLALPAMDEAALLSAVSQSESEEEADVVLVPSSAAERPSRQGRSQESKQESKRLFAWPSFTWTPLRWATLAAGIAVAVFVVRPALEHVNEKPNASINSAENHAPAPAEKPAPQSQIASNAPADKAIAEGAAKKSAQAQEGRVQEGRVGARVNDLANGKARFGVNSSQSREGNLPSGAIVAGADEQVLPSPLPPRDVTKHPAQPSTPGMQLAGNMTHVRAGKSLNDGKSGESKRTDERKSEAVEVVAGGSAVVGGSLKDASPDSNTIAQNDATQNVAKQNIAPQNLTTIDEANGRNAPAVVKSKPPLPMTMSAARAASPKQIATWAITQGVLQRSVDGGQTWQAAMRAGHPLLCYASRGLEMWAGGEAGTLLHSSDNGATWNAVAVSLQGQPLTSAVTNIVVHEAAQRSAAEILLSTGDHQTFLSADGGKTWKKK